MKHQNQNISQILDTLCSVEQIKTQMNEPTVFQVRYKLGLGFRKKTSQNPIKPNGFGLLKNLCLQP